MHFAETVASVCRDVLAKAEDTLRESAVDLVTEAQKIGVSTAYPAGQGGFTPVDTGWLRSSLEVSFSSMPQIDSTSYPPHGSGEGLHEFEWNAAATYDQVRQADLGEPLFIGWTAAYSLEQEYANEATKAFARKAAQKWTGIVAEAARNIMSGGTSTSVSIVAAE